MKNKFTYLLVFFLVFFQLTSQVKQFDLSKGNCQLFNGNLYTYGLSSQKQNAQFCIYKLDAKLKVTDSLVVPAGKGSPENYLATYSDTLHDYLNIYLQQKEKKAVTVFRINKKFELISTIENVEIARLNNTAMFGSDAFYFKNNVYALKIESDTSGKQFYLNKYFLKSEKENFDYEFKWQFPFERRNIHSAHIFYANKGFVFLFVTVSGGNKAGQWILKINAEAGKLEKATKLNDKEETNSYLFGTCFADKNYKSISLVGPKYTEAQLNLKESKLAISNAAFSTMYSLEIDSLGEVNNKQEFKVPVNDIKTIKAGVKKDPGIYLSRLSNLTKRGDGGFSFTADIFRSANSDLCYLYSNSTVFNLIPGEDKLVLEKNNISPNLMVEQFYSSPDKLDMNGKLCIDSLDQFERLFYKSLTFPVKQLFKFDADKNPVWILSKHTVKKNGINFSFLNPVKKVYQLTTIEEMSESNNPVFTSLSSDSFIISSQTEEGKYQLKLYNW